MMKFKVRYIERMSYDRVFERTVEAASKQEAEDIVIAYVDNNYHQIAFHETPSDADVLETEAIAKEVE